jgi:hypothetical protein
MTDHRFTDALVHDGRIRMTDDGAVVQARVAKSANVQTYLGSEMGLADRQFVRVYRPADAVFDRAAVETYARKPITLGHPAGGVSADTWKDLAVGEIDRDVMRDGEFVSVPLLFRDAKAIALLQSADGPRELSMGYDAKIVMQDGVSPSGEPFDAVMSDFRMNHVAVVAQARGGSELRIGDGAAKWGLAPLTLSDNKEDHMSDALKAVVLGDAVAHVAPADAALVEKFKADMAKQLTDAETAHAAELATRDAALAKAEAERDEAKGKILSDADLDQRVAARADLIGKARAIHADLKPEGLSDAAIRKAAVVAKLGDAAIEGKSEAYVDARFDILAEDAAKTDPVADALRTGTAPKVADDRAAAEAARTAQLNALGDAWKGTAAAQH